MDLNNLRDPSTLAWSSFVESFASFRDEHIRVLQSCTSGDNVPIDAVRHVVTAALRRSAALIDGFLSLVDSKNQFCAIPLIRLQLDSAMRVHACGLVTNPADFVRHILEGGEPRKYRDGTLELKDVTLHTALTQKYPHTTDIYQNTNGYVHLSNHHLFGVFDQQELKSGVVQVTDQELLPPWDESHIKGAMTLMLWATHILTDECLELLKKYPQETK